MPGVKMGFGDTHRSIQGAPTVSYQKGKFVHWKFQLGGHNDRMWFGDLNDRRERSYESDRMEICVVIDGVSVWGSLMLEVWESLSWATAGHCRELVTKNLLLLDMISKLSTILFKVDLVESLDLKRIAHLLNPKSVVAAVGMINELQWRKSTFKAFTHRMCNIIYSQMQKCSDV